MRDFFLKKKVEITHSNVLDAQINPTRKEAMRNSYDNPQLMQPSPRTKWANMWSSEASTNLPGRTVCGLYNACKTAKPPHSLPIKPISLIDSVSFSVFGDEVDFESRLSRTGLMPPNLAEHLPSPLPLIEPSVPFLLPFSYRLLR